METYITVTDNSSEDHVVQVASIAKYTAAGGSGGIHSSMLLTNGQAQSVQQTVSAITALIATAQGL